MSSLILSCKTRTLIHSLASWQLEAESLEFIVSFLIEGYFFKIHQIKTWSIAINGFNSNCLHLLIVLIGSTRVPMRTRNSNPEPRLLPPSPKRVAKERDRDGMLYIRAKNFVREQKLNIGVQFKLLATIVSLIIRYAPHL